MVNLQGVLIEWTEIESYLQKNGQLKEICQKVLHQKIINRVAQERHLTVTDEEIQAEADCFRRQMRLEKAADTLAWLADELMTPEDWETGIRERLLTQKLAESLFGKEVEKSFAENKLNFEQIILYQIIVPYETLAWEIFYQIEEEEISFYQAAHLYNFDAKSRYYCGFEGQVYRWILNPEISSVLFSSKVGEVIPPLKTEQGYHLFLIEEFISPELTPEIRQEILNKMFNEWLTRELNYLIFNSGEQLNTSSYQD
ncbi:peptidylprolyl isomerase [Gloeothece citriformis]|nr:peptidylprolyl isomerase [Gloeothece citriformis]